MTTVTVILGLNTLQHHQQRKHIQYCSISTKKQTNNSLDRLLNSQCKQQYVCTIAQETLVLLTRFQLNNPRKPQGVSEILLVLMLRLVRLWQEMISSSSISVRTLACLRYGIRMHGRTPNEIRWRLSLISSHSSSSPISPRSGPSGTHSPAMSGVLFERENPMSWCLVPPATTQGTSGLSTHPELQRYSSLTWGLKKQNTTEEYADSPRPVGVWLKVCACVFVCGRIGKPVRQALCEAVQRGTGESGANTINQDTQTHTLAHVYRHTQWLTFSSLHTHTETLAIKS